MNEQERFIQQIKGVRDYWLKQRNLTTEEIVNGAIFSMLVMIDGDSSVNDFHKLKIIDTHNGKRINCDSLHEMYRAQEKKPIESRFRPCPFCGKTESVEVGTNSEIDDLDGEIDPYFAVSCSVNKGGCGAAGGYMRTKDKAIEKWNMRAEREGE